MKRLVNRRSILSILIAFALVATFAAGVALRGGVPHARAAGGQTTKSVFCSKLGKTIQASSGAQMFCKGSQPNGPATSKHPEIRSFGANVDAGNPGEDVSPSGVQAYGQSETSIAASGHYAVEAWNDATGFFATCGAPMSKEELTGLGFSANSGASYADLGGLTNAGCNNNVYDGDPAVEAWTTGGKTYFYVASLFNCNSAAGCTSDLARILLWIHALPAGRPPAQL